MQQPFSRRAGILLAVSSLPSKYGIGTLGKPALRFIDFLKRAGQSYWQVLPLNPVGIGDSPYAGCSAFAGNPLLIDPDLLKKAGLLQQKELAKAYSKAQDRVDYTQVRSAHTRLLKIAHSRFAPNDAYHAFCNAQREWLEDYALFMALRETVDDDPRNWSDDIRRREPTALARLREELADRIAFYKFCQFQFFTQWQAVKAYANQNGIEIIGDVPLYIAYDSADVWAEPEIFLLDDAFIPLAVSGVPPDSFSDSGQLWGTPIYNWARLEQSDFSFWKRRFRLLAALYDIVRIDHFIGLVRYYAIPFGETTAAHGEYFNGPGQRLLDAIQPMLGDTRLIAEDLGIALPAVEALRRANGIPGMQVLQTAFETTPHNQSLPCNCPQDTVVYTGTHDNNTLCGYIKSADPKAIRFAKRYLAVERKREIAPALLRAAYACPANTLILPMQDLLCKGASARMNTPATVGGNWQWRVRKQELSSKLCQSIRRLTKTYNRLRSEE